MSRATRLLDVCAGRMPDRTPVWLMRQAGRYQRSYRELRDRVSFFDLCRTPELAAQVTVRAVEDLSVDAAIIFSDILVPLAAMGAEISLPDAGPRIRALRDRAAIDALRVIEPATEIAELGRAIELTCDALDGAVPLIGFAGAPLTLACYLAEGRHSSSFAAFRRMLAADRDAAHQLLDKLARVVARHLRYQVRSGCRVVQLFDSWAGILGAADYREHALPYVQRIFAEIEDLAVPRIFFGTCTTSLLPLLRDCGADVVGVDWRVELADARRQLGDLVLQGNLDPCYLFLPREALERRVARVLEQARGGGHIFNLGHGVLPDTPPENARFVVETVHRLTGGELAPDE